VTAPPVAELERAVLAMVGVAVVAVLAAAAVAAATRCELGEPAGDCGAETLSGTADPCPPTLGQP
jgi:hypothetical protein